MSNQEVPDLVASLRKGDEVEIIYRGAVSRVCDDDVALSDDERWCLAPHDVRVIKRAPLPEPPVGTPVWFRVEWWLGVEQRNARTRYFRATDIGATDWRVWETMDGAVPAATPGGDDE